MMLLFPANVRDADMTLSSGKANMGGSTAVLTIRIVNTRIRFKFFGLVDSPSGRTFICKLPKLIGRGSRMGSLVYEKLQKHF